MTPEIISPPSPKRFALHSLSGLFRALKRIEVKLQIDGLYIRLNTDESGSIAFFSGRDVFRFDTIAELEAWIAAPAIICYPPEEDADDAAA